jgi:hypothetical protein
MASRVPWSQEGRLRAAKRKEQLALVGKVGVVGAFVLGAFLLAIQL